MSEIAASSPLRMAGTIRTALALALALALAPEAGRAFTIENAGPTSATSMALGSGHGWRVVRINRPPRYLEPASI
jgi:hypothetical protein